MIIRGTVLVATILATGVAAADLGAQASTVIFVRHAEKAATPSTSDPDLSDLGRTRAAELVAALTNFRLDAVYVTEYRRTRQTGDSVAMAQHLAPIVVSAKGDPKAYAAAVVAELRKLPPGSAALVVGHSNTFASIIVALGGPRVPDFCDAEYGSLYVLQMSSDGATPRVLKASYGAPDSPEGIACSYRMRLQ